MTDVDTGGSLSHTRTSEDKLTSADVMFVWLKGDQHVARVGAGMLPSSWCVSISVGKGLLQRDTIHKFVIGCTSFFNLLGDDYCATRRHD